MSAPSISAVVPVYNHAHAVGDVVDGILAAGLPCLLVDDGSEAACAAHLDALAAAHPGRVEVLHLPRNQGKGGAVMAGMRALAAAGYSHALQIDADGQHDTRDIPRFVAAAQAEPQSVICGCPIYDDSVPAVRFYGRYATHVFVWLNTLSFAIRDSMCGFRVYPLTPCLRLIERRRIGTRMDFDTEIMVRLYWDRVGVLNMPTRVRYPSDGVSHFRLWADNRLIAWMHARLLLGMLWRAPMLLPRASRARIAT